MPIVPTPAIIEGIGVRARQITQTIADLSRKPWSELRIVDLGSYQGTFSIDFALRGASVVAIEGREESNAQARSAANERGLRKIEFVTDDVRNFSRERFGVFDVVVCAGVLYHLPGVDGCRLVHSIADACTHLAVFDLHVGLNDEAVIQYGAATYHGVLYTEHGQDDSTEQKMERSWASLDNPVSFWFTRPSLLNLLRDAGFSSVFEVLRPLGAQYSSDRLTFVAVKGAIQESPYWHGADERDVPEVSLLHPFRRQPQTTPRWKRMARGIKRRIMP